MVFLLPFYSAGGTLPERRRMLILRRDQAKFTDSHNHCSNFPDLNLISLSQKFFKIHSPFSANYKNHVRFFLTWFLCMQCVKHSVAQHKIVGDFSGAFIALAAASNHSRLPAAAPAVVVPMAQLVQLLVTAQARHLPLPYPLEPDACARRLAP